MDTATIHAAAMEQLTLLHCAWRKGTDGYRHAYRAAYLESIVALRASRNAPDDLSHQWAISHRTAAYCAAHAGRPRLARLLYERGMTTNTPMPLWLQDEYARIALLIEHAEAV